MTLAAINSPLIAELPCATRAALTVDFGRKNSVNVLPRRAEVPHLSLISKKSVTWIKANDMPCVHSEYTIRLARFFAKRRD